MSENNSENPETSGDKSYEIYKKELEGETIQGKGFSVTRLDPATFRSFNEIPKRRVEFKPKNTSGRPVKIVK